MSVATTKPQAKETGKPPLVLSSSPHLHSPLTAERAMYTVLATLLPVAGVSAYIFGWRVIAVMLTSVISALVFEGLAQWARRRSPWRSVKDGSAVLTGMLLALTLPPSTPLWLAVLGAGVAILLGKQAFGGLGHNLFNPALVGRVFLLVTFPQFLTDFGGNIRMVDAVTSATPLTANTQGAAVPTYLELLAGYRAGALGETAIAALLLGGLVLLTMRIIDWRIPAGVLGSAALFAWAAGRDPLLHVLSGGLVLGAFFMATDWVTSPMNTWGQVVFGLIIGVCVVLIRVFSGAAGGVAYSILIGNAFVPLLDKAFKPKRFGEVAA